MSTDITITSYSGLVCQARDPLNLIKFNKVWPIIIVNTYNNCRCVIERFLTNLLPCCHTHTHTPQLGHGIEEGFIPAKSVDEILVVSDSPTELVDQFCLRWRTAVGDGGHAADVM